MESLIRKLDVEQESVFTKIKNTVRGIFTISLLVLHTLIHTSLIVIIGIPAMVMPDHWRLAQKINAIAITFAKSWIVANNKIIDNFLPPITWQVNIPDNLSPNKRYMMVCNHLSSIDPAAIHYVVHNKVPFTHFFGKHEILYIPFFGWAVKALGFPMVKRNSRAKVAKNPKLKWRDLEVTKKSCRRIKHSPYALVNFTEGTRITKAKYEKQQPHYTHLLNPKYGGVAVSLNTLGDDIDALLDVTLIYPNGTPSFWDVMSGRVGHIVVTIDEVKIPEWVLTGDYFTDEAFKQGFKCWIDDLWLKKDEKITKIMGIIEHIKRQK